MFFVQGWQLCCRLLPVVNSVVVYKNVDVILQ